jgi:hypothetical protein
MTYEAWNTGRLPDGSRIVAAADSEPEQQIAESRRTVLRAGLLACHEIIDRYRKELAELDAEAWRDPDTGRTTLKPQPMDAAEAARALGLQARIAPSPDAFAALDEMESVSSGGASAAQVHRWARILRTFTSAPAGVGACANCHPNVAPEYRCENCPTEPS